MTFWRSPFRSDGDERRTLRVAQALLPARAGGIACATPRRPMSRATVFAPGSVGNVGPGFDILGLAIDGIGDRVTVELGKSGPVIVRGLDAALVPADPAKNGAAIAAQAMANQPLQVTIDKGLPVAAGLGR